MSGELSGWQCEGYERIPESEHTGPVYDNGDAYATVAELRAQYAADGDPLPSEVWGCAEHTRVVVLAI